MQQNQSSEGDGQLKFYFQPPPFPRDHYQQQEQLSWQQQQQANSAGPSSEGSMSFAFVDPSQQSNGQVRQPPIPSQNWTAVQQRVQSSHGSGSTAGPSRGQWSPAIQQQQQETWQSPLGNQVGLPSRGEASGRDEAAFQNWQGAGSNGVQMPSGSHQSQQAPPSEHGSVDARSGGTLSQAMAWTGSGGQPGSHSDAYPRRETFTTTGLAGAAGQQKNDVSHHQQSSFQSQQQQQLQGAGHDMLDPLQYAEQLSRTYHEPSSQLPYGSGNGELIQQNQLAFSTGRTFQLPDRKDSPSISYGEGLSGLKSFPNERMDGTRRTPSQNLNIVTHSNLDMSPLFGSHSILDSHSSTSHGGSLASSLSEQSGFSPIYADRPLTSASSLSHAFGSPGDASSALADVRSSRQNSEDFRSSALGERPGQHRSAGDNGSRLRASTLGTAEVYRGQHLAHPGVARSNSSDAALIQEVTADPHLYHQVMPSSATGMQWSDSSTTQPGSSDPQHRTQQQMYSFGMSQEMNGGGQELSQQQQQQQPHSAHPALQQHRDSDGARLSLAMANAQLASNATTNDQAQHPPTIMEEDEDLTGQLIYAGTHRPPPQGLPNAFAIADASTFLPPGHQPMSHQSLQQPQQFYQADPNDTSMSTQDLSFDEGSFSRATLQYPHDQQSHQALLDTTSQPAPSAATQRRYKPAVRPSTYQQLVTMGTSPHESSPDAGEPGSFAFIDDLIRHYITTPSRLGLGERTVLIMTSKVAQKSYGAEKRFLCPPPMVLLIGSSWWNVCRDATMMGLHPSQVGADPPTVLTPPRVNIGMSGEANTQDGVLEWATSSGRLIDVGNPSSEMAVSGRCIGRQLYITDFDEKRKACETLVSVMVPGISAADARLLGTFSSKPIKIISKPSKKRQSSRNTDLGIVHGSIVSLFHRLRSQTVSTRYLCVSGAPTWFKGSDGQPFLNVDSINALPSRTASPSCFVAKMTSWDPFVVYLVDTEKTNVPSGAPPLKPHVVGYPPPPPNVLPVPGNGSVPMTIHYNQKIVLQCLNTAVVSPVMVIRKIEKATTVIGGAASQAGSSSEALGDPVSQLHKIALEVVEDASAPAPFPSSTSMESMDGSTITSTPGESGPFLACLNEAVGMRRPVDKRKWLWSQHAPASSEAGLSGFDPSTPGSSFGGRSMPPTPESFAAAYAASQSRHQQQNTGNKGLSHSRSLSNLSQNGSIPGGSGAMNAAGPYPAVSSSPLQYQHPMDRLHSQQSQVHQTPDVTSDGGKVRRPRRSTASSSTNPASGARSRAGSLSVGQDGQPLPPGTPKTAGGRRRGLSLTGADKQKANLNSGAGGGPAASDLLSRSHSTTTAGQDELGYEASLACSWSVDIADSDVWTIVGTDIARHTFWIPPKVAGGIHPLLPSPAATSTSSTSKGSSDLSHSHLITTPAPAMAITPVPVLNGFVPPGKEEGDEEQSQREEEGEEDKMSHRGAATSKQQSSKTKDQSSKTTTDPSFDASRLVTLLGENLSEDLYVYFGDWRSTIIQPPSSTDPQGGTKLYCTPPPPASEAFQVPSIRLPIILVRRDGVIFPSECIYSS